MELELVGTIEIGPHSVEAEICLRQNEDASLQATVHPKESMSPFALDECVLQSASGSSGPALARTRGVIIKCTCAVPDRTTAYEVQLIRTDLQYTTDVEESRLVNVAMALTNIPLFRRNIGHYLNLAGDSVRLQAVSEGCTSHVAGFEQMPYCEIDAAERLVEDFCWLCSFASGSLCAIHCLEVTSDDDLVSRSFRAVDTNPDRTFELIQDDIDSEDPTLFVESSMVPYRRESQSYPLPALIHMGVLAKNVDYLEVKCLLMSNFIEMLRYSHATNVMVPAGALHQKQQNFEWTDGRKPHRASLRHIVEDFCTKHRLTGWSGDFIKLRNEIVHTGKVGGTDPLERYLDLHHFCDQVILALLDWDGVGGSYIPINKPSVDDPGVTGTNRIPFVR